MELQDLVRGIPGFAGRSHADKIRFFAWFIHTHKGKDRFNQAMIRACYDELHYDKPSDVSPYIHKLIKKKPRDIIKDSRGFYLEGRLRQDFDSKYGEREITVSVHKLLAELPGKVSDEAERKFLSEALTCFKHGAFRAAMVMTWNLAYSHFTEWVFHNHLSTFNARIPIRYPKKAGIAVARMEDFGDLLKESEVIEICNSANIIDSNLKKILNEKLDRRNMAAHPSLVEIGQLEAEAMISDLVSNVVLRLT